MLKVLFSRLPKVYPDPAFRKCFTWNTKKDPKGLKKVNILPVIENTSAKTQAAKVDHSKKTRRRKRKISILRSSPSRPSRGGRGRGASPRSPQTAAPSQLLSPARRAPRAPGLSLALASGSPAAASPTSASDTPTRRRAGRRRNLLRCRNRNRGCTDNVTFTTEDARNQHERYTCRALNQVCI